MSKKDVLNSLIKHSNGYLFVSEVQAASVSRTYLAEYVRDNHMERVAKGIYISESVWPDELFIMQKCYPGTIISGETALYLHGMTDREYGEVCVSVPQKFSGSRLKARGVVIHREKPEFYSLGITEINTNYGNTVRVYDRERCICDLIRYRKKYDIQTFQTAIREYMHSKNKDLSKLIQYAQNLNVKDEVMKYVEVMI